MIELLNEITIKINTAKKELERLENCRSEQLGNSINYIENELQIQRLQSEIETYSVVIDLIKAETNL